MKIEYREFVVQVPKADGSGVAETTKVMVPVCWDEEIKDWLMTPEAHEIIDDAKARLAGLLLPAQLRELRERYEYTQKEMGELFQVGEKSWTRWESGKHRPSRVINVLIRALYEDAISINYLLKLAGKPPREVEAVDKFDQFSWAEMCSSFAGVAHVVVEGKSWEQIQIQSQGHGRSGMLNAILHKMILQPATPIGLAQSRAVAGEMVPDRNKKRFDHEKVNLASPYPSLA